MLQSIPLAPPCVTDGEVLFLLNAISFTPDVTECTPSKKINFCLVSSQIIFPKRLGGSSGYFEEMADKPLSSFFVRSGFFLKLSHGCCVCPVSFVFMSRGL